MNRRHRIIVQRLDVHLLESTKCHIDLVTNYHAVTLTRLTVPLTLFVNATPRGVIDGLNWLIIWMRYNCYPFFGDAEGKLKDVERPCHRWWDYSYESTKSIDVKFNRDPKRPVWIFWQQITMYCSNATHVTMSSVLASIRWYLFNDHGWLTKACGPRVEVSHWWPVFTSPWESHIF